MRNSVGAEAALVTTSHQVLSEVGVGEYYEQHVSRESVRRLH
jgi:hypothetical protein